MQQVEAMKFMEKYKEYLFPNDLYTEEEIECMLLDAPALHANKVYNVSYRDPKLVKIIAVFPGVLGIDRFMLGDIKMGVLKYFTFGGLWIWWIKDIGTAKNRCRNYNCKKLVEVLENMPKSTGAPKSSDDFDIEFGEDDIVTNHTPNAANAERDGAFVQSEPAKSPKIDKDAAISIGKAALSIGKALKQGLSDINKTNYIN